MAEQIQIEQFMALSASFPVVDVRAPFEYDQGHIPGAINIPLFDDHERKVVGTTYKQINKEAAMYAGLEFAGKKLVYLAKQGERAAGRNKTLLIHCWRGGMRSKSMVWLFETIGLTCYLLEGGYKSYRRYGRDLLARPFKFFIIGGRTGSGKTAILKQLLATGKQVVDLEALAHHKGSAFGALGELEQPTTEQFENNLGEQMAKMDPEKNIFVEDESRNIGKCVIPGEFYARMKEAKIIFLDIPRESRARHLVADYAKYSTDELKSCVQKIQKKLGGDRTKEALESIENRDFYRTAMITLHYYDKAYMHSLEKNHKDHLLVTSGEVDAQANASIILENVQKIDQGRY
jgi:tRNA 2-selenouridine synthase